MRIVVPRGRTRPWAAYATVELPLHVIVDPCQGRCFVHTDPKNGDYVTRTRVDFGDDIDLTDTVADLTVSTSAFPRD
ncbi:hypothetical protein ACPCK2_27315 [Streptomyces pseudogriseolus]|uniref:hypothetical protein n=1 Tax=Streptomyces pseudogriseolus TaxID=36817 RepID=UPI003FA341FF